MSLKTRLLSFLGLGATSPTHASHRQDGRTLRARYDAAATDSDNRRHWANADQLSARAANSPSVRAILRSRSRYEVANNCYAQGIIQTLANDVIGTGPRLQLHTGDNDANTRLEVHWAKWAAATRLAEKLRTLRRARAVDGEGFAVITSNRALSGPIKLDLRLVEAEQVTTPGLSTATGLANAVDGIRFDDDQNPIEYHILPAHPGDSLAYGVKPKSVPAEAVIHWFRIDRPGQARGIPDIMAALPLFAYRRRFMLATVAAAEAAANFAGILYTDSPATDQGGMDPWIPMEFERSSFTSIPNEWKVEQLKAEHPGTTFDTFDRACIREICRCISMPLIVATGDSSQSNYASGRLDWQTYYKAISVERSEIECLILDRLVAAWLDEAALIPGLIPDGLPPTATWSRDWNWDGREHVDPNKEANAQDTRLRNGMTSPQLECGREGRDWEAIDQQNATAYGITLEEWRALRLKNLFQAAALQVATTPDDEPTDVDEPEPEAAHA